MNKKFLCGILCGALLVASASTFVSCKDYDDDISGLQKQVNDNKNGTDANYASLKAVVEKNMTTAQTQIDGLTQKIDDATTAYKQADDNLKSLIDQEAAARETADEAERTYVDAQIASVQENLDAAKAEALAAAQKAYEEALKDSKSYTDEQIASLKSTLENAIADALTSAKVYTDAAKAEALAAAKEAKDAAETYYKELAAALEKAEKTAAETYATKVELENAKKALQAGIDAAQADATKALQNYETLSAKLDQDIKDLKAAYEAADETLKAQLQEDITAVKTQLATEVGKLVDADAALEKEINAAKADIDAANEEIDALQTDVAGLQSQLKNLEDVTIPEVKKQIADAKTDLEASIKALSDKHDTDVKALTDELGKLTESLAETNKNVAALQTQLDALQENVDQLNQRVADMQAAITGAKNDLAALTTLFDAFKAETADNFVTVWDSVAGLDARCAAIEAKAVVLENSLNETKQALAELAEKEGADVTALYAKIASEKEAIIKQMGIDIAAAKAELTSAYIAADKVLETSISTTKAELQTQIATAITTCKAYTDAELKTLKEYVNSENLKDRGYTDTEIANLKKILEAAIATGDANTLTDAKKYTDDELAKQVAILKGLINDETTAREKAIAALAETLRKEFAEADTKTLTSAKTYADEQIASLKETLEKAIKDGDEATAKAAQEALDKVEEALKKSIADTKKALQDQIDELNTELDKLAEKEAEDVKNLKKDLEDAVAELEKKIADGDEATLDAAKKYADEMLAAAKKYTDEQIDILEAYVIEADKQLGERIDEVIKAYTKADDEINKRIDEFKKAYDEYVKITDGRLEKLETGLAQLNEEFDKVKSDLYELITSIVYQGDGGIGSWTAAPIVKADVPLIYYATQTADQKAWPSESLKNHAPAIHQGHDVFQYQKGHFYATVNPSNVDLAGKVILDLENSLGEKSLYFSFGALEAATDTKMTKGTAATGLYKMDLLPRPGALEGTITSETPGFNFDQIKNDKALYAMAANWTNKQGQAVKVSATYGLDNFENYCEVYPSAKPGKHALPEFKFYTDDKYTTEQGSNPKFSNYEYAVDKTNLFPTAYLKLDTEEKQWNYKWFIEFYEYTDNNYVPGTPDPTKKGVELDPTELFEDYTVEVYDSITFTKSFKLKNADYINKRILVRVRAINYLYEEMEAWTVLSFTRPLFDPKTLTRSFYPGDKLPTEKLYFAAQMRDTLGTDGVTKYNSYASANGAVATIWLSTSSIGTPGSYDNWSITDGGSFDLFTYNPLIIGYKADAAVDNTAVVTIKDKADHNIIVVTLNAHIKTPYHLDYQILKDGVAQNRIPASFDFKHSVKVGEQTIPIQFYDDAVNKDMVLVWPSSNPATYDLKGAYINLNDYVADANTALGATPWFVGDWKASNESVYEFVSSSADIAIENAVTPDHYNKVTVKDNVKAMTIFANKNLNINSQISDDIFTETRFVPYDIYRRISYYNCSTVSDRYYSAAVDTFKMTFASPINYGLFRAASDVEDGETYTIEYSLVRGANSIKFDDAFPDYSVITSGAPKTFGLNDSRIAGTAGDDNVQITVLGMDKPERTYLEGLSSNPIKAREITFTYTNTAAISEFILPCELKVTDIWGISTSIKFNLKFLPNKL